MLEQDYKSLSLISAGPSDGHYVLDYKKSLSIMRSMCQVLEKHTLRSNIMCLQVGATEVAT